MKNKVIRNYIEESGLKYWEVAHQIGVTDATFSKWLRVSLDDTKKERVMSAIKELKAKAVSNS